MAESGIREVITEKRKALIIDELLLNDATSEKRSIFQQSELLYFLECQPNKFHVCRQQCKNQGL